MEKRFGSCATTVQYDSRRTDACPVKVYKLRAALSHSTPPHCTATPALARVAHIDSENMNIMNASTGADTGTCTQHTYATRMGDRCRDVDLDVDAPPSTSLSLTPSDPLERACQA